MVKIDEESYGFLIDEFTEERIDSRCNWLYDLMAGYLCSEEIQDEVLISQDILNHVIIDYYVDVYRLKEFQNIKMIHESKIYAYIIFWFLRHKPLQLKKETGIEKLAFVNEYFATDLLRGYLFDSNVAILKENRKDICNFTETLLYYFKYRDYSAKGIEMIVLAFSAGKAYQYSLDYSS